MKVAILCIAFFLVLRNSVESRSYLSQILREELQEILKNNKDVEYNSEHDHKDSSENENRSKGEDYEDVDPEGEAPPGTLNNNVEYNGEDGQENGNKGSGEEGLDPAGAVGFTEMEVNAMNNYKGDEMIIAEEDKKRGVGTQITLWPRVNGKLKIPYTIFSTITSQNRGRVSDFISAMNNHLKNCNSDSSNVWVQRTNQPYYVQFQHAAGCYSYLGYIRSAPQVIGLNNNGCVYPGIVQHEMLHAMGFSHEQSRSDRDQYVRIITSNIRQGMEHNFLKLSAMRSESEKTKYDYGSVMHYGRKDFSRNGQDTIVPINPSSAAIGQRVGLSQTDITEVLRVYNCGATTVTPAPPTSGSTLLECKYKSGLCTYFYSRRWSIMSGFLRTKASTAFSFAYIQKSRLRALNNCPCPNGQCEKRNFCVEFKYTYTNPVVNKLSNSILVYGIAYQGTKRIFSTSHYAPGGSGCKTMKVTMLLNCGPSMAFVVRTGTQQRYEVEMDDFIIKYGSC